MVRFLRFRLNPNNVPIVHQYLLLTTPLLPHHQVYFRIKDIDAFEEQHVDFADVLIPFCQATNTPLTATLMEVVKKSKTREETVQVMCVC